MTTSNGCRCRVFKRIHFPPQDKLLGNHDLLDFPENRIA